MHCLFYFFAFFGILLLNSSFYLVLLAALMGGDSPQLALGSCFTYFRHLFLRRRFFVDPNLRDFFCSRSATSEFGNPTRGWQAGCDRQAHRADGRLVSSAPASKWDEKRSPRNLLLLQGVSASLAGLGARSQVSPGIEFLRSPVMHALSGDASVPIDTSPHPKVPLGWSNFFCSIANFLHAPPTRTNRHA